jgi:hypothetical protein
MGDQPLAHCRFEGRTERAVNRMDRLRRELRGESHIQIIDLAGVYLLQGPHPERRQDMAPQQGGIPLEGALIDQAALAGAGVGLPLDQCKPPIDPHRERDFVRRDVLANITGADQPAELFTSVR